VVNYLLNGYIFLGYIITIGILSSTFETLYIIITNSLNIKTIIPSGPYGIIASTLYLYYKTVPVSFTMKVLGITFSDKFFSYLLAFQVIINIFISILFL